VGKGGSTENGMMGHITIAHDSLGVTERGSTVGAVGEKGDAGGIDITQKIADALRPSSSRGMETVNLQESHCELLC
jgi:Flp pilus assembly CpaE family ATPase